jgi:hypothetical protein
LAGAGGETGTECAHAAVADPEADFGDREVAGGEQSLRGVHAAAGEETVRGFAEDSGEEALEVKRGEAGFAGGAVERDGVGEGRRDQVAGAAGAAESHVVYQGHGG